MIISSRGMRTKVTLWPGCWSFPPLITLVSTQQGFPVPWFLAFIHVTGPCLLSLIWWSFPRQFLTQFANEILKLGCPDEYLSYFSSVFFPWSTGVHSKAHLLLLPLLSSIWRFEKPPIFRLDQDLLLAWNLGNREKADWHWDCPSRVSQPVLDTSALALTLPVVSTCRHQVNSSTNHIAQTAQRWQLPLLCPVPC